MRVEELGQIELTDPRESGFCEVRHNLANRCDKGSVRLSIAFGGHPIQISEHRILRREVALYLEMGQKGVFALAIIALIARVSISFQLEE